MRPLRYSINVTLDGCCDHRAISANEDLHHHAVENLNQADALLFGRVTYQMMEAAAMGPSGLFFERSLFAVFQVSGRMGILMSRFLACGPSYSPLSSRPVS